MVVKKHRRYQNGASAFEALITLPIIFSACLLVLQMMLIYRAKIALNFATQEAARIGAMSNGRPVPRFLTDVTQYMTVVPPVKCVKSDGTGILRVNSIGRCPSGSTRQQSTPRVTASELPRGTSERSDGDEPTGDQFSERPSNGAPQGAASAPAALPDRAAADAGESGKPGVASQFFKALGRGMMRFGDSSVLQGFIIGIAPLYTTGKEMSDASKGQLKAFGDAMLNSCIVYHSPTQAAFADFGFIELDGPDRRVMQIPNDLLRYRIPGKLDPSGKGIGYLQSKGRYLSEDEPGLRGVVSSMSVQDANLLSIEIKYSYSLEVPIAREILIGLAMLTGLGSSETSMGALFVADSLRKKRWPLASFATYRMQTPVHWHPYYPFGDISKIKTPAIEGFDLLRDLYNTVADKVNDKFDPAVPQAGFCPGLAIGRIKSAVMIPGTDDNTQSEVTSWIGEDYDKRNQRAVESSAGSNSN